MHRTTLLPRNIESLKRSLAISLTTHDHRTITITKMPMSSREGTIPFHIPNVQEQCFTWYRAFGDITKTPPLILVHGGPGAGSDYHLHLAEPLQAARIPCIFYDQVGCSRSSLIRKRAEDETFWDFDLFCAEIENLVDHFQLREVGFSIYGYS